MGEGTHFAYAGAMARCSVVLLPFLLLACGSEPTQGDEQDASEVQAATITFDASFDESVDGLLMEGSTVVIAYDDERLAQCRGEQNGIPQYAVTAHYSFDGAKPRSIVVAGLNAVAEPSIELDSSGQLEIWFEATNRWGCHAWDSDFGNNYTFQVVEEQD